MVTKQRRFFVLGLPRSRTAWLSVLLDSLPGVSCSHEALRRVDLGHGRKELVLEQVNGWGQRPAPVMGECTPTGGLHYEALNKFYPNAAFACIIRPFDEVKASMAKLFPTGGKVLADELERQNRSLLAASQETARIQFSDLDDYNTVRALVYLLTGEELLTREHFEKFRRLNIQVTHEAAAPVQPERPLEAPGIPGMSCRMVAESDHAELQSWAAFHEQDKLDVSTLPPMGILAEDQDGPLAAMWAFESFHSPVCHLAWPITRPCLSLKQARDAIRFVLCGLKAAVGSMAVPPGHYTRFVCNAREAMGRELLSLGFVTDNVERKTYYLDF